MDRVAGHSISDAKGFWSIQIVRLLHMVTIFFYKEWL